MGDKLARTQHLAVVLSKASYLYAKANFVNEIPDIDPWEIQYSVERCRTPCGRSRSPSFYSRPASDLIVRPPCIPNSVQVSAQTPSTGSTDSSAPQQPIRQAHKHGNGMALAVMFPAYASCPIYHHRVMPLRPDPQLPQALSTPYLHLPELIVFWILNSFYTARTVSIERWIALYSRPDRPTSSASLLGPSSCLN
jgi:hypothetical protein